MPVTQKDIAREAGVSQTVVSDVLHGRARGRVSPETRQRILDAAARLEYRPNASARALRLQQSSQIAYLAAQPDVESLGALSEVSIGGLARVLSGAGYRLLLQVAPSYETQVDMLAEMFATGVADGGVVRAFDAGQPVWEALREAEKPVVVIGQCEVQGLSSVAHDAPGVLRGAVELLHRRGHRHIVVLGAASRGTYFRLIRESWDQLSAELGYPTDAWKEGVTDRPTAASLSAALLTAHPSPTAFLCLNERVAVGVRQTLREHHRRLGEDADLVVIGGAGHSWLHDPGTWLFGTDLETIGRLAGEEVLRLLAGEAPRGAIRFLPELRQL